MTNAAELDAETAAAIARAEARRAVLERVTQLAMALMEEVVAAKISQADEPAPRRDAERTFAQLSRAVRMTLALEERIDARILTIRNGELPARAPAPSGGARRAAAKSTPAPPAEGDADQCPVRDPIQAAVWSAIDQTVGDEVEALHRFDRLYERLFESGEYDRLDLEDFESAVKAICADLRIEPDWTSWDGDAGFAAPETPARPVWRNRWTWRPAEAEDRRKRLLADETRPEAIGTLARAGPFQLE